MFKYSDITLLCVKQVAKVQKKYDSVIIFFVPMGLKHNLISDKH